MFELPGHYNSEILKNKFNDDFLRAMKEILSGQAIYFTRSRRIVEYEQIKKQRPAQSI